MFQSKSVEWDSNHSIMVVHLSIAKNIKSTELSEFNYTMKTGSIHVSGQDK